MAKTKISEYDAIAANNTDVNSINIAEGCAPSGINNAIRQVMADLKDFQQGTKGDAFLGPVSSSSLTLSSLTANRVLYTNGSKVVATSDNMQFDGTTTTINALTVSGAFAANGGATLGDGSGDALTINSSAVSIPNGLNFDSNTLVIDATNNRVSVGTNNPVSARQFTVSNTSGNAYININGGTGTTASPAFTSLEFRGYLSNRTAVIQSYDQSSDTALSGGLLFYTNANMAADSPTERMRIDSSGNVGIGTSSPSVRLDISGSGRFIQAAGYGSSSDATVEIGGTDNGFVNNGATSSWRQKVAGDANGQSLRFEGFVRGTGWTQRMRIDSSGNLFVNATGFDGDRPNATGIAVLPVGDIKIRVATDTQPALQFYSPSGGGSAVGSVNAGASSTSYNTSSDYRLKENIAPMTDALAVVGQLKPCTYTWKADGSNGQGFIAHELQAVVPDCVTGEKDAVETYTDEDGVEQTRPKYQGIDTSFLVATLTAAIQEMKAIIDAQAERITALENK